MDKSKLKMLYEAFQLCENEEEVANFLTDLCTYTEIEAMADRLHVAKLLSEKETYEKIEQMTKMSSATISRVNRSLLRGSNGYQIVLDRLNKK
ncbi:MAG TPA: hypothetical protein DEA51_03830 [Erysipelotrichaceae bacterium]|nr:hypothetical protein [Erysipelotrichaceae bacterium]